MKTDIISLNSLHLAPLINGLDPMGSSWFIKKKKILHLEIYSSQAAVFFIISQNEKYFFIIIFHFFSIIFKKGKKKKKRSPNSFRSYIGLLLQQIVENQKIWILIENEKNEQQILTFQRLCSKQNGNNYWIIKIDDICCIKTDFPFSWLTDWSMNQCSYRCHIFPVTISY